METKPSDVMRAWFERVWTNNDVASIDALLAADGEVSGLGGDATLIGPEEFRKYHRDMLDAFGSIQVEVVDAIDCGDRCYTQCVATLGGRDGVLKGGCLSTVRDGKIQTASNCWDFLGLLQSMQAIEAEAILHAAAGAQFQRI